jgi:hypothetical protein
MRSSYKILHIALLAMISWQSGHSQTKSIDDEFTIARIKVTSGFFLDVVEASGKLYALDIFKDLFVIDLETSESIILANDVEALVKDKEDNILVATRLNGINKYVIPEGEWKTIGQRLKETIYALVVDGENTLFAVTSAGIYDIRNQKYYHDLFPRWLDSNNFLTAFMDVDENIWLWYNSSRGDWSVLSVFDTKLKKSQEINTNERRLDSQYSITSFFNSEERTYMTAQYHEYIDVEGFIIAFEQFTGSRVLKVERPFYDSITVGPGTFYNDKIYFISRSDIYAGSIEEDLQKEEHWEIIAKLPNMEQFEKAGFADFYPVSTKLIVRDDRIIMLTQSDGIIVLKGSEVRIYHR